MFLTIFTPAYNRAATLPRLYDSLCRQTCRDFEWIVVDDGSTDNTPALLVSWKAEGIIPLRFHHQRNAGKMAAHNRGVEMAAGDMFVCVDSDDFLTENAVEALLHAWQQPHEGCIGVLAFQVDTAGHPITSMTDHTVEITTLKDAYSHHGLSGDTMLIFNRSILNRHSFPVFEGETFVPENYLYDQLDQEGPLFLLRKGLYICEYRSDGYSANIARILYDNPRGYLAYIRQRLILDNSPRSKFTDAIRFVGMSLAHRLPLRGSPRPFWVLTALLPGLLLYLIRYRKFEK